MLVLPILSFVEITLLMQDKRKIKISYWRFEDLGMKLEFDNGLGLTPRKITRILSHEPLRRKNLQVVSHMLLK